MARKKATRKASRKRAGKITAENVTVTIDTKTGQLTFDSPRGTAAADKVGAKFRTHLQSGHETKDGDLVRGLFIRVAKKAPRPGGGNDPVYVDTNCP